MIIGSGIDLIDNGRLERELTRQPWTCDDGVFTRDEIHFCNSGKKTALLYAACFAAKEATLKALGLQVTDIRPFRDVEFLPDGTGNFNLKLHGSTRSVARRLGARHLSVAVTSTERLSGAVVILES